jgi:hypothetical protein
LWSLSFHNFNHQTLTKCKSCESNHESSQNDVCCFHFHEKMYPLRFSRKFSIYEMFLEFLGLDWLGIDFQCNCNSWLENACPCNKIQGPISNSMIIHHFQSTFATLKIIHPFHPLSPLWKRRQQQEAKNVGQVGEEQQSVVAKVDERDGWWSSS